MQPTSDDVKLSSLKACNTKLLLKPSMCGACKLQYKLLLKPAAFVVYTNPIHETKHKIPLSVHVHVISFMENLKAMCSQCLHR